MQYVRGWMTGREVISSVLWTWSLLDNGVTCPPSLPWHLPFAWLPNSIRAWSSLSPLLICPAEGFCSFLLFQPYLFSLGASFPLMASAPASVFLTPVSLFRPQFFSDPTWGSQGLLSCSTSRMNALSSASASPVLLLCLCHG